MNKLSQHDLCVLALAQNGGWMKAYELEKKVIQGQMIGSEADTRMYEIFDKKVSDAESKETKYMVGTTEYLVETRKEGNRRLYRASSKGRRVTVVDYVFIDGIRHARPRIEYVPA